MNKKNIQKNRLFSVVSHEIKNALNPVINLSGLLAGKASLSMSSEDISYLRVIERNGRKIERVIDSFSIINKIFNGAAPCEKIPVDIRDLADSAIAARLESEENTDFDFRNDIDQGSSIIVERVILRKIIGHILDFYISIGRKNLVLKSFCCDGKLHIFAASGDSHSTPSELLKQRSVDADELKISESSMMWLDFISLFSDFAGGGAAFFPGHQGIPVLSFYADFSGEAGLVAQDKAVSLSDQKPKSSEGHVMLVIDDDPDNIISLRAIIDYEFNGSYELLYAENGKDGLDILENVKPDIILLDINLPDISGITLVRNIKNFFVTDKAAVIAFTGLEMTDLSEQLKRSGFDDFIPKPFEIDDLVNKVKKWTDFND